MSSTDKVLIAPDLEKLERSEVEAMVNRLSRAPRLANLLRFIGDHYFRGEMDQLREHTIAIHVFGRPEEFDPAQDAIARVEAHRLRKKLKEYYSGDGKNNAVQITLPAGTYIPQFVHSVLAPPEPARPTKAAVVDIAQPEPRAVEHNSVAATAPATPSVPPKFRWRNGVIALAAVLLILIAVGLLVFRPAAKPTGVRTAAAPDRPSSGIVVPPLATAGAPNVVRILAGYTGPPHPDPSGAIWEADHYFQGGGGWRGSPGFTARTNDPLLFQTIRSGDAAYAIPLQPGAYELHLYFVEPSFGPGLGGGEGSRTFNVYINGRQVLPGFDIESDAMGLNVADERVFKDVGPGADGKLHVNLESQSGKPPINGLAVVPAQRHKQNPIRLTMQASPYIDHEGHVWNPDNYYNGGQVVRRLLANGTPDPDLFNGL